MAVALFGLAANAAIVWLAKHVGLHYLLAQVLTTALVLGYLLNAAWTFRAHAKRRLRTQA